MQRAVKTKAPTRLRTPQQARSRRTREQILEAAVACFETQGYEETTTAEIARRARIAVGTFYLYFKDKRSILLELLDGTINEIANYVVQNLQSEAWQHADARASVRNLIDALFHTRTINPGLQRILWERYFKDPQFRAAVQAIEQRVRAAMLQLFTALDADGRLRVIDLSAAAFVVYTAIEWTASRIVLGEGGIEIGPTVEAASDMVSRFLFRD
jgi:AcrR family transcriptional regulator